MISGQAMYFRALDDAMRQVVARHLSDEEGFGLMLRYALGWEDENGQPYSVPTGKRLRPFILLLCATAVGDDWQRALPAAAAVELLHNFSLIHDDIQDNSPLRHNRPTVWKVWGVANAINAGDAMFVLSYAALADLSETLASSQLVPIWQLFNATNIDLTRGQHLDMHFESQAMVSVEQYVSMIHGKSAALIATAAQLGALIVSGDPERAAHFADFGLNLGIAFQIHDDILGIWGETSVTGKSVATDIESRKKSLPVLYGLHHDTVLESLYQQPDLNVAAVVERLESCGALEYTRAQEQTYYDRAMIALDAAQPRSEIRPILDEFVQFLFQRNY